MPYTKSGKKIKNPTKKQWAAYHRSKGKPKRKPRMKR